MVTSLSSTSCNTAAATAAGSAIGAYVGREVGGSRGAYAGAAIGALVGYAISEHYNANAAQRREAERRAQVAIRRANIRDSQARYVAVPVSKQSGGGRDVVLYDKKKGTVDDKAYVPPSGVSYSQDQVVTVGGKKAIVASAFQGV
ncbi:MAG: glycine zipper domain-containing protein [Verrucomicrobiota bacterium]